LLPKEIAETMPTGLNGKLMRKNQQVKIFRRRGGGREISGVARFRKNHCEIPQTPGGMVTSGA
jgi:hypothetical protein